MGGVLGPVILLGSLLLLIVASVPIAYALGIAALISAFYVGIPMEATSLARLNLMKIRHHIDQAEKQSGLDDLAKAHLGESKARIDRALDAGMISTF